MARINLLNLRKVFKGNIVAVNDVNLEIEEGIITSILGPSGCGKTTTMRLIAGFEAPTKGSILFNSQDVTLLGPYERKVGMVFQLPILYDDLTVYENIAMPLKVMKKNQQTIHQNVHTMCEFFDIPESIVQKKARKLDIAERQKVSLAHTFISDKNVYLLDEPLSNLDPRDRVEIRSKIKRYQNEAKKTILYVTHDQTEAMSLSKKIAVMKLGVILQYERNEMIYEYPKNKFVGWFLGNPGMNFLEGVIVNQADRSLVFENLTIPVQFELPSHNQHVTMGIRPEYVEVSTEPKEGFNHASCYFTEPIGNRMVAFIKMNESVVKAKIDKRKDIKSGSTVWFNFPSEHILLYDEKTGDRITL